MRLKDLWFTLSLLVLPVMVKAEHEKLQKQLQEVIAGKNAQVGIAVILNGKDTITVNNNCQYPMMSVFKLYQALAVADYCQKEKLSFETSVYIRRSDLKSNTYSPLRDRYPQGEIFLPIKELLKYTLHLSDNNACDILFARTGGTEATDKYIRSLGIRDFSVEFTEDEMHKDINTCYRNWSTPLEAVKVMELLLTRPLFDKDYQDFIKQAMVTCETGKDRLPFPLEGTEAIIGHKTGTGDLNDKGQIIGINDVGFVYLPNGKRYTIAVFIKDSAENMQESSRIIADISRVVYQYVSEI